MIDIPKAVEAIAIPNREYSSKRVFGLSLFVIILSYWVVFGALHHHDAADSGDEYHSCLMLHTASVAALNTFNLYSIPSLEIVHAEIISVGYKPLATSYLFIRAPPLKYA